LSCARVPTSFPTRRLPICNRAREALRVMEEYARFVLNDAVLMRELKELRHGLAEALAPLDRAMAILSRDTAGDVGTGVKTVAELDRKSTRLNSSHWPRSYA